MQAYSREEDETDPHKLPDLEVFELTAREVAEQDEDRIHEWMRKPQYRLAAMNSRTREAMFDAMIEEECIEGGWFYWYCFPGCMPESSPFGPYESAKAAHEAAREEAEV